jgi:hypothetical protein
VTKLVLDDHLLRDVLAGRPTLDLRRLLRTAEPATTNLYYLRLCRSVVAASGGQLTGILPAGERRQLGRSLIALSDEVEVVPMQLLAFTMAELADRHGLSSLGAEAIAASKLLDGSLCVSARDDGPRIRAAARRERVGYRVLAPA